jgi:hypothetical protein
MGGAIMTDKQVQDVSHIIEMSAIAELEAEKAFRISSLQVRNEDIAEAIMERMLTQNVEQDAQKWN